MSLAHSGRLKLEQGVLKMKILRNVLVLMIVACVMGPELTRAKQPDVRTEIEKLGSSDPTERATAAKTLGYIGNSVAVEPLISSLKDDNRHVRENAVTALRWIRDPRAVDSLVAILKDEDGDVRDAAVRALGWLQDPRAVEPLIAAFEKWPSMSSVRSSLKDIGRPAVEPLNTALKSDNPAVRTMAAKTLGKISDPVAVEPLISSLKDENRHVRKNAVTALRWIRDPRAVEPLIAALKDDDGDVRDAAARALGWFRDPRGAGPLIAAFENWPSMSSVGSSLEDIGRPAVESLNAALKSENPAVRTMAARTLGDIGDPGAVEPLISSLKDNNRDVRENAAAALRWIRDPRAVEPLIAALKDEDESVQSKAAGALKAIAGKDLGIDYKAWKKWWDEKEADLP